MGRKVGAGTFGVIIRAVDKKSRKEYALKMIKKGKIKNKEHAELIIREKQVVTYLSQ